MGTELIEIVEIAEMINNPAINTWLLAGKTTGFVVIALVAIVIIFAKTGVINKFIDFKIQQLGLSTGFSKDAMKRIDESIDKMLANDQHTKDQMVIIQENVNKNSEAIQQINDDLKDVRLGLLKKVIVDKKLFLIDRMADGIRYLQEGFNSEIGDYLLNQLCFEDLPMWDGLCKLMKAAKYWRNEKDRPKDLESELPRRVPQKEGDQNDAGDGI